VQQLFCFGFNAKSIVVLEKISLYFHESAFVNESGFKSGIKCTCLDFSLDMHYKKVVSTNELLLSLVFLTFDKWYNYLFDRGVHRQPLVYLLLIWFITRSF
jgi:hypothetical protein